MFVAEKISAILPYTKASEQKSSEKSLSPAFLF